MLDILYEIKSSNMSEENHKKLFSSSEYQSFLSNKVAAICKALGDANRLQIIL